MMYAVYAGYISPKPAPKTTAAMRNVIWPCAPARMSSPSGGAMRQGSSTRRYPMRSSVRPISEPAGADGNGHRRQKQTSRRNAERIGEERRETRQAAITERDQCHRDREQQHTPFDELVQPPRRVRRRRLTRGRFGRHVRLMVVGQPPRNPGHQQIERHDLEAERRPSEAVHPEAERRRSAEREHRGQPPVAQPFRASRGRNRRHHVRARRREQRRPEETVHRDDGEEQPVVSNHRIARRKDGQRKAHADQHATVPEPIADRSGQRCRKCRRICEEPEKETGGRGRSAELEDTVRRSGQQLKY